MTFARPDTFRQVGQIVATTVLPALVCARKLPLRISCIGIASDDAGEDAASFDRLIPLGERRSPEDAMCFASSRVARGDIRIGPDRVPHFQPRILLIQDHEGGLVLAGDIRAGIILWQQPVTSDAEARQVVAEASKLRGMAVRSVDPAAVRKLRFRAAILEARLVDPIWRETAADLTRLPQAA